jgi:hypothetical protein
MSRDLRKSLSRTSRRLRERLYGNYDCKTVIIALHRERAVYFAVPKVASSSIEYLITDLLKSRLPDGVVAGIDDGLHFFRGKAKRREMRDRQYLLCKHEVRKYPDYYTFAFVRNPWSRLVSCYLDKIDSKEISGDLNPKGAAAVMLKAGAESSHAGFDEFVRAVYATPDEESNRHFRSQHTFVTDRRGHLLPQNIFRFENLATEFNSLADRLGLPETAKLPHRNPSRKTPYQDYYTEELRELVAERYRRDIELFGYEFE